MLIFAVLVSPLGAWREWRYRVREIRRKRTKALRIVLVGHIERIARRHDSVNPSQIEMENRYFWWAWHELGMWWPHEREAARQQVIECAKLNAEYLIQCTAAGVFRFNQIGESGRPEVALRGM